MHKAQSRYKSNNGVSSALFIWRTHLTEFEPSEIETRADEMSFFLFKLN